MLLFVVSIIIFNSSDKYGSCNDQLSNTNNNNNNTNNNNSNNDDDDDDPADGPPLASQTFEQWPVRTGLNPTTTSTLMSPHHAVDNNQGPGSMFQGQHPATTIKHNKISRHRTRTRVSNYLRTVNNETIRTQSYCIQRPARYQVCSSVLDYGHFMRLPNNVGHKNEVELMQQTNSLMENLPNVQCEAISQLKLVLCSLLSPSCLNAVVLPCRQSCFLARTTCRAPMQRLGLEWPTFLDCRQLPASQENCIGRTLSLVNVSLDLTKSESSISPSSPVSSTKRRRKMKKVKNTTTTSTTTTTTTTSTPPLNNDLTSTSTHAPDLTVNLNPSTTTTTTSQGSSVDTSTESVMSYDAPEKRPTDTTPLAPQTFTPNPTVEVPTTHSQGSLTTLASEVASNSTSPAPSPDDYSSMPINVTNDLTQLICSSSPDWLIKTKLTDNQLLVAARKRDLKVRVFRQVFGSLVDSEAIRNATRAPASQKPLFTRSNSNRTKSTTNLSFNLSNNTMFISAVGTTLYTQPLTNALRAKDHLANHSNQMSNGTTSHKTGRYYLISGTGSSTSTAKLANVFIVWPNFHRGANSESDSRASRQILKTYREFKLSGYKVCDRLHSMTRSSLGRDIALVQTTSRRSVRARKSRKELPAI